MSAGLYDPFDRRALLTRRAGRGEGVVEVRPDLGGRPRLGHLVTGTAVLDEQDTAPINAGGGRPTTRRDAGERPEEGEDEERANGVQRLGHRVHGARAILYIGVAGEAA